MELDHETCYRALVARDVRFDGVFFVGVKTTGIYCRPICTARTPRRASCRFYPSAAAAEGEGFRPCLRCRPELSPGQAPVDAAGRIAAAVAARIEAGALNDGGTIDALADEFQLCSRQLRRVVRSELGVSPVALAQTHRLLLAKRLLSETRLPAAQVAFASGFGSVRRFNAVFHARYRLSPLQLRRSRMAPESGAALRLSLAYRPPLAWDALLSFLAARATPGVECVSGQTYCRTVAVGSHRGWISASPVAGRSIISVEISNSLVPALGSVLASLKNLFDLNARPDVIAERLAADRRLATLIARQPGLRTPGACSGFELAVRVVLGQQISVRGASTLSGRLAAALGEPIETPLAGLSRVAPTAERIASASRQELCRAGMTSARADCLRALARSVADGRLQLAPTAAPETVIEQLRELPGIGDWTAQYIAMRALRWPDAFPAADLGLRKALEMPSARDVLAAAEAWRPWRAYAAMHLWNSLTARQPVIHPKRTTRKSA